MPAGDKIGLASAIARVAARPDDAARMGATNLGRAPRHHIEACARDYEALFQRFIG